MMLRSQAVSGLQGKAAQASKSPLVAVSSVASRKHAAFKPARVSVRAAAAEPEAKAAPAAGKREKRVVTVDMANVKPGAEFEATVSSVEAYGAFVNFGAEKDGLVHISQLSNGFIKNAGDVVKVGDKVKVKVLSYDATQGRVALTMKGMKGAGAAAAASEDIEDSVDIEEEEDVISAAAAESDLLVASEGYQYVYADGKDYDFPFEMEEEDAELTVESVAAFEDAEEADFSFEHSTDVDVPIHELVSGTVTRVEEYGVFVTFKHNGKEFTALLERDEAKVPASALSAEVVREYTEAGELTPKYIDMEVDNVSKYYKVGDAIDAFVLEYNDANKMALTQYADWEVEAQAYDAPVAEELLEDLKADGTLADFSGKDMEVLAMDPMQLIDSEEAAGDLDFDAEVSAVDENSAVADYRAFGPGSSNYTAGIFTSSGEMVNPTAFPSRPLNKVANAYGLASTALAADTDFDGDEIYLEDFWQSTFTVPKGAIKKLGYKVQFDDKGEAELVEREGGAEPGAEDVLGVFSLGLSHEERVSAFVKDLLDDDEDEAELPARMARRPVVLAMDMASISAAAVKDLRAKTGAGMMDCKKALAETDGKVEDAIEWLRKKGLSGADKKAGRIAAEGAIISYIHPGSRLGVMLEVNCETDFVAASDAFQALARNVAMQIAASPAVQYVAVEDIPAEVFEREKQLEMQREDIKAKPEAIRAKIAEGRAQKIAQEMALLPQPYLVDGSKTVEQAVKEAIAALGEKISIRRFIKFQLGEGIEKRTNDFAAEVAAATGKK